MALDAAVVIPVMQQLSPATATQCESTGGWPVLTVQMQSVELSSQPYPQPKTATLLHLRQVFSSCPTRDLAHAQKCSFRQDMSEYQEWLQSINIGHGHAMSARPTQLHSEIPSQEYLGPEEVGSKLFFNRIALEASCSTRSSRSAQKSRSAPPPLSPIDQAHCGRMEELRRLPSCLVGHPKRTHRRGHCSGRGTGRLFCISSSCLQSRQVVANKRSSGWAVRQRQLENLPAGFPPEWL